MLGLRPITQTPHQAHKNHLVIVGFGLNGRNVARAARAADIPYVIIEMDTEIVRNSRSNGEPIFYGDAVHDAVAPPCEHQVGAGNCGGDFRRCRRAPHRSTAHALNPAAHIVVRTRHVAEVEPLYHVGANEVIPEEFETSVENFYTGADGIPYPSR